MPASPPRKKSAASSPAPSEPASAEEGLPERERRSRRGQELTRKHLLGTVYEFISENGIENLSMRKIAQAADLSTGTINYYFGNKQRLLIAALESAYELPDDWEQYKGSPLKQLQRLLEGYVCRSPKDRFWRFWINYLASSTRNDELHAHQADRYRRQHRFWAKLLRDGQQAGEFRNDIDPDQKAEELLVLAHGLLVRQLAGPEARSREIAHAMLLAQIEQMRPAKR